MKMRARMNAERAGVEPSRGVSRLSQRGLEPSAGADRRRPLHTQTTCSPALAAGHRGPEAPMQESPHQTSFLVGGQVRR